MLTNSFITNLKFVFFTFTGSRISSAEWTKAGRECAVLRVGEKFIDDVYCNATYGLVICETQGI